VVNRRVEPFGLPPFAIEGRTLPPQYAFSAGHLLGVAVLETPFKKLGSILDIDSIDMEISTQSWSPPFLDLKILDVAKIVPEPAVADEFGVPKADLLAMTALSATRALARTDQPFRDRWQALPHLSWAIQLPAPIAILLVHGGWSVITYPMPPPRSVYQELFADAVGRGGGNFSFRMPG
jgi:hypothetical protein